MYEAKPTKTNNVIEWASSALFISSRFHDQHSLSNFSTVPCQVLSFAFRKPCRPSSRSAPVVHSLGAVMGRDIDENATLPSVPQWTRVEWAAESAGTQTTYKIVNGKRNHGRRDSGSDSSEDYLGPANKTFLDTETLCSRTGSLAHLHLRPRPFHHYQDPSTPATCSQPHAQRAHAYAQAFASTHSRQQSQSQSQSQAQAQHQPPLQSPVESDTSDDTEPSERSPDLVYRSFLSSPHTSLAAMPSPQLSAGNGLDMHTVSTSLTNWPWRQEQKIELRLPKDSKADDRPQTGPQRSHQDLEDADSNSFSNNLLSASAERRPSSSRSHLRWRRNRSLDRDASNYLRVSSDDQASSIDVRPSMIITRDEFEALPPTIKRKVSRNFLIASLPFRFLSSMSGVWL